MVSDPIAERTFTSSFVDPSIKQNTCLSTRHTPPTQPKHQKQTKKENQTQGIHNGESAADANTRVSGRENHAAAAAHFQTVSYQKRKGTCTMPRKPGATSADRGSLCGASWRNNRTERLGERKGMLCFRGENGLAPVEVAHRVCMGVQGRHQPGPVTESPRSKGEPTPSTNPCGSIKES